MAPPETHCNGPCGGSVYTLFVATTCSGSCSPDSSTNRRLFIVSSKGHPEMTLNASSLRMERTASGSTCAACR